MLRQTVRRRVIAAALLAMVSSAAYSAIPVQVAKTDLKPLIRAAVRSEVQFAVPVPHSASTASAGIWSVARGRATWNYAVRVPTAVSLSFHAAHSSLPPSALLVVRGAQTVTSYHARDLHGGDLWSRIHPGDALQLTLTVDAGERRNVSLNIVSLQAGYRSLGPGVVDHPYYRQLKAASTVSAGNAACVTNYECKVNASNTPVGAATMGLVISNLYQCTGSLINNVPGYNTPYVLTARHCETGQIGGGDPSAAFEVTVYWDAITSCGTTLGSLYDPGIATQTGAQTVVEQQDAWLIKLDVTPVVADAQFAGFDASGGAIVGGYTIHHAEGNDKQFAAWFGQAAAVQSSVTVGTAYAINFWETVNQIGNIGPGASGSGLIDQNNHLVGSLTLGRDTTDPSGYGSCPVANPSAPNGSNGVADFTSLAAVWNSTADSTSSTGSVTIKSVLDPDATGTVVVPSAPVASITLSASADAQSVEVPLTLTWSAPGALQCTEGGGIAGDGWSGSVGTSGTQVVTESAGGAVTYTLSCTSSSGRLANSAVTVSWVPPAANVTLSGPFALWTTRPATLSWTSNVAPCALSGGALALSNLPSTGTTATTQSVAGDVKYTLTCGPTNNQGSSSVQVIYVTPSLILEPTGTDRILGQSFSLEWNTYADTCIASGGAPNDGWAGTAFGVGQYVGDGVLNGPTALFYPNVTTLGTYTYTLVCSAGSLSVQQSVTVTFENNAPYTTASLSTNSVTYSGTPADYATVSWDSNISSCLVNTTPQMEADASDPLSIPYQSQGSATLSPPGPGSYVISVTCEMPGNNPTFVTSAPLTLTVLPPPAPTESVSLSPSTVVVGQAYTVSWSSTNSSYCAGSGGVPNSGWSTNGLFALAPAGNMSSMASQAGQVTFGITCESISPMSVAPTSSQAELQIVAATPTASLQSNTTSIAVGQMFTLTWSSTNATACTASGGGANGSAWSGSVATSGSLTQTGTVSGSFIYSLVCAVGSLSGTPQQVTIDVVAASSSGGSGGGGFNMSELVLLALLAGIRCQSTGIYQIRRQ